MELAPLMDSLKWEKMGDLDVAWSRFSWREEGTKKRWRKKVKNVLNETLLWATITYVILQIECRVLPEEQDKHSLFANTDFERFIQIIFNTILAFMHEGNCFDK